MNENVKAKLEAAGVDVEEAVNRFAGNTGLYLKFLNKLPGDENFSKIKPALDADDMDAALTAVHTLKGVSGNLSVNRLFEVCSRMVTLIREGKNQETKDSYEELAEAYEKICEVLEEL